MRSSLRTSAIWAWLALIAALAGCSRESAGRADLVRIDGVEQRWDRVDQLIARGEGMPQGERGEARLVGLVFLPERPPRALDARVPCRALDKNRVAVDLAPLARELSTDAPFEGRLTLEFGSRTDARLAGTRDQVVARLGRAGDLGREFGARQRAQAFQRELGIRALVLGDEGVSVAELDPKGAAARGGLALHDRVLRVGDGPVQLPRDVVAQREAGEVLLTVQRGTAHTRHTLRVRWTEELTAGRETLWGLGLGLGAALSSLFFATRSNRWLWAPRRKEYYLALCLSLSLWLLALMLCAALPATLASLGQASLVGLVLGYLSVCCSRLLRRTSRTTSSADLAPLV
ncbi:MAG TPA: hypothetical protein VFZ61_10965 [Polyangiales bacterium]